MFSRISASSSTVVSSFMEEFAASINEFLAFRKYDILSGKGRISGQEARAKAEGEYAEFNKTQRISSDFDREVKRLLDGNKPEGSK